MNRSFAWNRRSGFALITALGVMVLLTIIAFGAATTGHFTYGFAKVRQQERNTSDLLREAAYLVADRAIRSPAGEPFHILALRTLNHRDVEVSGTLLSREHGTPLLGAALERREGDEVVELAAEIAGRSGRRTAVYLVNLQGARTAPILLLERRL